MTDELRAKFEVWATIERRSNLERDPLHKDDYNYRSTDTAWKAWQAANASRDAEVEALKAQVAWMREYEKGLNRRAEVEEVLFEVARGKRAPLSADECRNLAIKLGCAPK